MNQVINSNYENMHVAFVHNELTVGGGERVTYASAERLARWGVYSHLIAQEVRTTDWIPQSQYVSVAELPDKRKLSASANGTELLRLIREHNISILFITVSEWNLPFQEIKEAGCRIYFWIHQQPLWESFAKYDRARLRAKKSFLKWLEWKTIARIKFAIGAYEVQVKHRYRKALSEYDYYITLCPEYTQMLIRKLGLSQEEAKKIFHLTNTIDLPKDPCLDKKREIVYVGRFEPTQKKVMRLLQVWNRIFHRLPEWELKIYGSGVGEEEMRSYIETNALPRVKICGYISDPSPVYERAAILCNVSEFEGWPVTFMEAQSYGVVPIAFNCVEGIPAMLGADQSAGVFTPPYDLDKYAEALVDLCTDDVKRQRLQSNCIARSKGYSRDVNDETWLRILEDARAHAR